MNSSEILDAIEQIAADPSKKTKESLVGQFGATPEFVNVLVAALNPFKTYGIAKVPKRAATSSGTADFDERTWQLLRDLEKRVLSGNAARETLNTTLETLNTKSAELLTRIVLKDLRADFSENTVNKAIPKLIPTFPYMRCSLQTEVDLATWPWKDGVFSQLKADGEFANVNVEADGLVSITTRQGSPMPLDALGELAEVMSASLAPGHQYHGELLVELLDAATGLWSIMPRHTGNGRLNSILKGGTLPEGHRVIYRAWDRIPLSAVVSKGKHAEPYAQRWAHLEEMMASSQGSQCVGLVEMKLVYSLEEAFAHYAEMLALGLEGTVVKRPDAIWADGTSKGQCKLKLEFAIELRIKGFKAGKATGKHANTFGSLLCESECGQLACAVSGIPQDMRDDINARREHFLETIVTITANDITFPSKSNPKHSLFLPRVDKFRADKDVADTLERIIEQKAAAIAGA
jgi:DNA ligase-1